MQSEITTSDELLDETVYEDILISRVRMPSRKLTRARFIDCKWTGVDLSMLVPAGCVFQGCRFEDCKAIGIDWTVVTRISACEFRRSILDQDAFVEMDLRSVAFHDCRMRETILSGADLTGTSLAGCDLSGATFGRTKLCGADLRRATGYVIHPGENAVRGMRVSRDAVAGLLAPFGIEIE